MRCQQIHLKNKEDVIVDWDSKEKCSRCGNKVWKALIIKENRFIFIELTGLCEWEEHKC